MSSDLIDSREPTTILGHPAQVACFSVCNKIVTANSTASLQYFKQPTQSTLLSRGCSTFLERHRSDLDMHHPRPLDNIFTVLGPETKNIFRNADVMTWRGIIVKIMLGTKIQLNMSFIDGILYLDEHDPAPNRSRRIDSVSYPGLAFEAACTQGSRDTEDSVSSIVDINPHDLWCSIISRRLGSLQLILAGEVDCVKGQIWTTSKIYLEPHSSCGPLQGEYTGSPDCFLELKTQRINDKRPKWAQNNAYKKWYLQSRMLGIGEIFVGHRDRGEVLRETEWIMLDELSTRVEGWEPEESIARGEQILSSLRAFCHSQMGVTREDAKVWRVEVCGGGRIPQGCVGVLGAKDVFVRDLSEHEMDLILSRQGERAGIIPVSAVEELRRI